MVSNLGAFVRPLAFGLCLMSIPACTTTVGTEIVVKKPEQVMSEPESASKISMTSSAKVEVNKLIVDYSIQSNWPTSLYIFDEMIKYDDQQKPVIDSDTAYRFFEEPKTLRLVRAVLNLPKEKDVYSLEMPYARELKPRQKLEGRISLDLPVNEKSPFYGPPKEGESKEVDCENIRLLVGWTEPRDGTTITEVTVGGQKALRIRGSFQPFLLENKVDVKTQVIVYTEVFDRQMPQNTRSN